MAGEVGMTDKSGTPPSMADVEKARAVVKRALTVHLPRLPSELAVELPNIYRCLGQLETTMRTEAKAP
jgi:hypothetical protein